MFIRPVGVTVSPALRPPGHPLLRGLLRRAAGAAEWATAEESVAEGSVAEGSVAEELEEALEEGVRLGGRGEEGREYEAEAGAGAEPEGPGAPEGGDGGEPPTEAEPPTHPPVTGPTLVAELTQLSDLARQGLLTPEEFTLAKGRLLRG
ncbi:hypothetical protein Slala03_06340 [Streptomyces lavendulae subsp. lavendulae]|uniref:hypothetical protein n=1 Tax=Streptomyces lavendulae TaxID=1914 RepID=UPI0024A0804B|nr:hypothetical protein [Streptomyces lavendulae]GLV80945.1 hypothetical protein Slala03_06340 [Streptomyces lavendulae subsp. lavendulae]